MLQTAVSACSNIGSTESDCSFELSRQNENKQNQRNANEGDKIFCCSTLNAQTAFDARLFFSSLQFNSQRSEFDTQ